MEWILASGFGVLALAGIAVIARYAVAVLTEVDAERTDFAEV
ncbi:hypothetical protein [Parafrigoribacterium soli]